MSTENTTPAAGRNALQDFTSCPEWGTGGQFECDPVTGKRTRIGEAPAPAGVLRKPADASVETAAAAETATGAGAGEAEAVTTIQPAKKERARG